MTKARAMVLGAGFGIRLRPLTDELPKPLVPVGDRSILAHIAGRLAAAGHTDLVLNTHHHADKFASAGDDLPLTLHLVHEERIRGTAGGIAGARALFGEPPILVWNGDILAAPPIEELMDLSVRRGFALCVASRPAGEGTVGLAADGHVVRLRGELFGDPETSGGDYVGIAALGKAVLDGLPDDGCLIGDVALPLLRQGGRIDTARLTTPWADVGSIAAYAAACRAWLDVHAGVGWSWVHPTAEVAPTVILHGSLVGAGAVVRGEGELTRAVVWPGAEVQLLVDAPQSDVIVTTAGHVVSAA